MKEIQGLLDELGQELRVESNKENDDESLQDLENVSQLLKSLENAGKIMDLIDKKG